MFFPRISYQHAIDTFDDVHAPNGALTYFFIHDYCHWLHIAQHSHEIFSDIADQFNINSLFKHSANRQTETTTISKIPYVYLIDCDLII